MTNNLIGRVDQHREGKGSAFTRKYKVHTLVWYQYYSNIREAIQREKTVKDWPRAYKVNLIERTNPHWSDLYRSLPGVRSTPIDWIRGTLDPGDKHRDDT